MNGKPYKIFHIDEGLMAVVNPMGGEAVCGENVTHFIFRVPLSTFKIMFPDKEHLIKSGKIFERVISDEGSFVFMPLKEPIPLDAYIKQTHEVVGRSSLHEDSFSAFIQSDCEDLIAELREMQKNTKQAKSGHLPISEIKPNDDEKGSHAR